MKIEPMKFLAPAAVLAALMASPAAFGVTVLVDEDFDSYASQNALEAVWSPDGGDGNSPSATVGIQLPTADTGAFPEPNNDPPGLDGGAIGGITGGGVNEYNGSTFDVAPTASENVVLQGDIFTDGTTGNWRQSIGLRNDNIDREPGVFGNQFGLNIIELGLYNADTCDPTADGCVPGDAQDPESDIFIESTQFMARTILFGGGTLGKAFINGVDVGDLLISPNYQYFQLDPELDLPTSNLPSGTVGNEDGVVDITDIGEGWHTFTATISETSILYELDLFRDGINNVTGSAEVDASLEYEIGLAEDPSNPGIAAGFTSLRVGGPSGITGNAVMAYDNISLATVEATTDPDPFPGDANGDGTVDLLDLDILGSNFGTPSGALFSDGDFNGDGAVDLLDLDILGGNFGNSAPASAIPEPTAAVLVMLGLGAVSRRR